MERRTPAQWTEYLSQEHQPITITEYMAACLSRLLGAQIETMQASAHTEGMVGTLDEFLAGTDPRYRQIADKRSKPTPMIPGKMEA